MIGVVGAIDCTHIRINSPRGTDVELFRNRKGYFSINVQAVCDADVNFTNIVSRWYGSAHDSRILENSYVFVEMDDKASPGIILGDAGYPLLPWLMTPYHVPRGLDQIRFDGLCIKCETVVTPRLK
jgi:hypothetical protein